MLSGIDLSSQCYNRTQMTFQIDSKRRTIYIFCQLVAYVVEALQQNMRRKSLTASGDAAASCDRQKPQTNGSVGYKHRQCSSTYSLTSTDELIAGSSLKQILTQRILRQSFQTDNHLTALLPGLSLPLLLRTHQVNLSALMRSMNCVHRCILT